MGLGKDMQIGIFRQVRRQADDIVARFRKIDQCVPERGRHGIAPFGIQRRDHGAGGNPVATSHRAGRIF